MKNQHGLIDKISHKYSLDEKLMTGNAFLALLFIIHLLVGYVAMWQFELLDYFTLSLYSEMLYTSLVSIVILKFVIYYIDYRKRHINDAEQTSLKSEIFKSCFNRNTFLSLLIPLLFFPSFFALFSATKSMIHVFNPFYLDEMFMKIDRFLHFGIDPWKITHTVFSGAWGSLFLSFIYAIWFGMMLYYTLWMMVSIKMRKHRFQYLTSFILCWFLLGSVLAVFLSSAGPVYFGRVTGDISVYEPLMDILRSHNEPYKDQFLYVYALDVQDYLWNSYLKTTIDVGTGISAMPIMHLSIAALLYFSAKELNKNFGYAMLIFLILIQIGSVHLGWHYAIDGYVSIFLTWLIWKLMGYLCDKIYHEE